MGNFRDALRDEGKKAIGRHSGLAHEWIEDHEHTTVSVPAIAPDGFTVQLTATERGIDLQAGSFHTDSGWTTQETFGLLFWNYFGRRTEGVYQNHHLDADA